MTSQIFGPYLTQESNIERPIWAPNCSIYISLQGQNETETEAIEDDLNQNLNYTQYYKVWFQLITTVIIPFSILLVCNTGIFLRLRKNSQKFKNSRHRSMGNNPTLSRNNSTVDGQQIYKIKECQTSLKYLAGVVGMFCVCQIMRVIHMSFDVWIVEKDIKCKALGREPNYPFWLYVVASLNHLMNVINSSGNFIIYAAVGSQSKFRKVLRRALTRRNTLIATEEFEMQV